MSRELMRWLGKQAASFILPPRKESVQTETYRLDRAPTTEEKKRTAVQSPHRYGRKVPVRPKSSDANDAT